MALYNTLALRGILIQGSSWCWQFSASKRPFFFFFWKEENGVGYLKIQKIIKNDAPPGLTAERTTRSRVLLSTSRQHAGARRSSRDGKLSSPENPKVLCSTVCTSNTAHVVNEIKAAVMSFFRGGVTVRISARGPDWRCWRICWGVSERCLHDRSNTGSRSNIR